MDKNSFSWSHGYMSWDGSTSDLWGRGRNTRDALIDLAEKMEAVAQKARSIAETQGSMDAAERIRNAGDADTEASRITFHVPAMQRVMAAASKILGK